MKWIILVYIAMYTPAQEELRYNRLEFPLPTYHHCLQMAREINSIDHVGYRSRIPFVRSLYWVRINLANKMRADCVYADPDQPLPDWTDDFLKRLDLDNDTQIYN